MSEYYYAQVKNENYDAFAINGFHIVYFNGKDYFLVGKKINASEITFLSLVSMPEIR